MAKNNRAFPCRLTYAPTPWMSSLLSGGTLWEKARGMPHLSQFGNERVWGQLSRHQTLSLAVITCVCPDSILMSNSEIPTEKLTWSPEQSWQKMHCFLPHMYIKASWREGSPHVSFNLSFWARSNNASCLGSNSPIFTPYSILIVSSSSVSAQQPLD